MNCKRCNKTLIKQQKVYCSRHCQAKSVNIGKKSNGTLKIKYKTGEFVIWNKGLTKDTNTSVAKYAKSNSKPMSENQKNNFIIAIKNNPNWGMKNKHHSISTKKKISMSWTQERKLNHNCIGRIQSKDEIEKRTKSLRLSQKWKNHCEKQKDYEYDKERRKNIRKGIIEYIKNNRGNLKCNIGKYETELLNKQELIDDCKIDRQFYIKNLGYVVDGYCPETNTVYEVYEIKHFRNDKTIIHDSQRQKEIQELLKCNFRIIKS